MSQRGSSDTQKKFWGSAGSNLKTNVLPAWHCVSALVYLPYLRSVTRHNSSPLAALPPRASRCPFPVIWCRSYTTLTHRILKATVPFRRVLRRTAHAVDLGTPSTSRLLQERLGAGVVATRTGTIRRRQWGELLRNNMRSIKGGTLNWHSFAHGPWGCNGCRWARIDIDGHGLKRRGMWRLPRTETGRVAPEVAAWRCRAWGNSSTVMLLVPKGQQWQCYHCLRARVVRPEQGQVPRTWAGTSLGRWMHRSGAGCQGRSQPPPGAHGPNGIYGLGWRRARGRPGSRWGQAAGTGWQVAHLLARGEVGRADRLIVPSRLPTLNLLPEGHQGALRLRLVP